MPDAEAEELFRRIPLLAAHDRASWRVELLGGITNRSYRLRAGSHDLVLRMPGRSASRYLDRGAEAGNVAMVAELGLAPGVLAADPAGAWYITAFVADARPLEATDFARPEVLAEVAALLGRLHRSSVRFPSRQGLFSAIDRYLGLAPGAGLSQMRRRLDPVEAALARHPLPLVPCHIDPNPANFLRRGDGGLLLLDWEFAAMEEPLWDLATIALEADLDAAATAECIEPVIGAGQVARFELYRTALELVAASWCNAELAAGNPAAGLADLRDMRLARLGRRLADPRHGGWIERA